MTLGLFFFNWLLIPTLVVCLIFWAFSCLTKAPTAHNTLRLGALGLLVLLAPLQAIGGWASFDCKVQYYYAFGCQTLPDDLAAWGLFGGLISTPFGAVAAIIISVSAAADTLCHRRVHRPTRRGL